MSIYSNDYPCPITEWEGNPENICTACNRRNFHAIVYNTQRNLCKDCADAEDRETIQRLEQENSEIRTELEGVVKDYTEGLEEKIQEAFILALEGISEKLEDWENNRIQVLETKLSSLEQEFEKWKSNQQSNPTFPLKGNTPTVFTNSLGIKFQYIPAGEFMMGNSPGDNWITPGEKPLHRVEISHPFYMGRYPVTQEEWTKVMGDKPFYFQNAGRTAPAEAISWNRVQEFINKLNEMESRDGSKGKPKYRLPTEAEWEYSARAGTNTALYVGKLEDNGYWESKPLDRIGWFAGNAIATYEGGQETDELAKIKGFEYYKDAPHKKIGPQPVGKKEPNPWGLYDTIGNVLEWCEDWFVDDYYGKSEIIDPKGPTSGERKVVRGGSWYEDARSCRVSYRHKVAPGLKFSNFGFRLLLPLS